MILFGFMRFDLVHVQIKQLNEHNVCNKVNKLISLGTDGDCDVTYA